MSLTNTFSALSRRGFTSGNAGWYQIQQIIPDSGDVFYFSPYHKIAITSDGNYWVTHVNSSPADLWSSLYVYIKSGTTWIRQATITLPTGFFGGPVSISINDAGDTILVSASSSAFTSTGGVYVYTRIGGVWSLQSTLIPPGRVGLATVSLDSSGNYAAIGQETVDTSPYTDNGAVYIYHRSGITWSLQATLLASDRASGDFFGSSLEISKDSNYIVIGAMLKESGLPPPHSSTGRVYVFHRSGTSWTQQLNTSGSDPVVDHIPKGRGEGLSITNDGSKIVFTSSEAYPFQWVFSRSGSTWTETILLNLNPTGLDALNLVSPSTLMTNDDNSITAIGFDKIQPTPSPPYINGRFVVGIVENNIVAQHLTKPSLIDFAYDVTIAKGADIILAGVSYTSPGSVFIYVKDP